jgi:hypothetical protein
MQSEHPKVLLVIQSLRHFSGFRYHFLAPGLLETVCPWVVGSPSEMAPLGQCWAHFLHLEQKSQTPNSMGLSTASGMLV